MEWIGHQEMVARKLGAYDARGQKVSRVRACAAGDGGIHVRTIVFVDVPFDSRVEVPSDVTVCRSAAIDADNGLVEAELFIKGGVIRELKKSTT